MRTGRRQNGPLMPPLTGGLVAASAATFLAFVLPVGASHSAADSPTASPGPSLTAGRTAEPQQALHTVTTTAAGTALRLAEPGGCPPVTVLVPIVPQPTELPGTPAGVPAVMSRPPLRILLCTWLN
jgi:hypothetical protein